MAITLHSRNWSIQRTTGSRQDARRSAAAVATGLPPEFLTDESYVSDEFVAQPAATAAARRGGPAALDFSCDLAEGEAGILAIRYPSGALTFHLPAETTRRGKARAGEARFVVTVVSTDLETGRR